MPVAVIEEERLNREKKTRKFPSFGLEAALTERGLKLSDIDRSRSPGMRTVLLAADGPFRSCIQAERPDFGATETTAKRNSQ